MTEPTKDGPLKRTIPTDLQEEVEKMQIKIPRIAGSPGDLDEEKKRWLIVGICLHSIISPLLRKYVYCIVSSLYRSLVDRNNIDRQGWNRYLWKFPDTNEYYLNYKSINNNYDNWKNDYHMYDYKVMSHVDLSKLFLQPNMTHYSAIDESCDVSALLGMITNISLFPPAVQTVAKKIKSEIRNKWAHCDFKDWNAAKYEDSFNSMTQLVKNVGTSSTEEHKILGELNTWATNGQNLVSGLKLGIDIVGEIRQQTQVLSEYAQKLRTETQSERNHLQTELNNLKNDLQKRMSNVERQSKKNAEDIKMLNEEKKNRVEDHIPQHIRAHHGQEIREWEQDQLAFFETRATRHILQSLQLHNCIVVTGSSGCGKSSIIHHAALHLRDSLGYEIIPVLTHVTGPTDIINYYNENKKQVFIVDDICGKETINSQTLKTWRDYSEKMEKLFKVAEKDVASKNKGMVSKVFKVSSPKLLLSCRLHIYKEEQFQRIKLFTKKECNLLSPELCLQETERMHMLQKYLPNDKINNVKQVMENVDYFPLLCKLSSDKTSEEVKKLFTAPLVSIKNSIQNIINENNYQFCALVLCVVFNNGLNTDWLTPGSVSERKNDKLEDIVKEFDIDLSKQKHRNSLKAGFSTLNGTFLKLRGKEYRMIHDKIYKMTVVSCGQILTECFIKYAPSVSIRDHFIFESLKEVHEKDHSILLLENQETYYFERLLCDLKEQVIESTFHNYQLISQTFRDKLINFLGVSDDAKTVLKTLSSQGCRINNNHDELDMLEYEDKEAHFYSTPLIESATTGYIDIVQFLIVNVTCDVNNTDSKGSSPLHRASGRGHSIVAKLLLEINADVSQCSVDGCSPLYVACEGGHKDTVELLLQNNADVNQCSVHGVSPLAEACIGGHKDTVELLLQNKADVNQCDTIRWSALHHACNEGYTDIVGILLQNNADVNQCSVHGVSPLVGACIGGHKDTVELLLQNKADVNQCDTIRWSALHYACNEGYTDIVGILLQNNAVVNQCDKYDWSPLFVASEGGHKDTVKLLLQNNADVNQCSVHGVSPLFVASEGGHKDTVELLLQNNADVSQCDKDGRSPLFVASEGGHKDTVELLLQNNADVSQCDKDGRSPFFVASEGGHKDTVELLLQNNADVNQCSVHGVSPLVKACIGGHKDTVELLLQNKADVNQCDTIRWSALHYACNEGYTDIVGILLQNNADVNQCSVHGVSPLFVASEGGHKDTVELLLQNNADVSQSDKDGRSPLFVASEGGHKDTVELLLQNNADVSQCDKDGRSPLFVASEGGHKDTVKLLLQNNADVNQCSVHGVSPLFVASEGGHKDTVELLLQNNDLQEHEEKIKSLESKTKKHDESLEEVIKQVAYHIPQHIRARHSQEIREWEHDRTAFFQTRATCHILESLPLYACIVVTGSSCCGKSSNIHHAALHLRDKYGYEIIPVSTGPTDILNYYNENRKQVFVVDDICGKETINTHTLQMWRDYSEKIEKICKGTEKDVASKNDKTVSKVSSPKLLISCRLYIYKEAQIQGITFFTKKECNLSSPELCLQDDEILYMLRMYLSDDIITKLNLKQVKENLNYFPLLCKLSKDKTSEEVKTLFKSPLGSIKRNIHNIVIKNKYQCCALTLTILFGGEFNTEWLTQMDLKSASETTGSKLEKIVEEFNIDLSKERHRTSLESGFATLSGKYLKQRGSEYRMIHDKIYKIAALICGQHLTECFIKYAPSVFIRDHFIFRSLLGKHDDSIVILEDQEEVYFERLVCDLKKHVISSTFSNNMLRYKSYRGKLISYFMRSNESKLCLKKIDIISCKESSKYTHCSSSSFVSSTLLVDKLCHVCSASPLLEIASHDFTDLVNFLISINFNVNVTDRYGSSPLHNASKGGHINVVRLLLQNNADVNQISKMGESPLFVACKGGHTDIVELLLQHHANFSKCNNFGESPLYVACAGGHTDIVKLLLQNNANVSQVNYVGKFPLYVACELGHAHTVNMLLQNKADVDQCNSDGESSLYVACKRGYTGIVKTLLHNNADFSQSTTSKRSPLFVACEGGYTDTAKVLLEKNADVSQCTISERSPLFVACEGGHTDTVELLLENNADVSQCNSCGQSPLFVAREKGHTDIAKLLRMNGADISQVNFNGKFVLNVANVRGHSNSVKMLLQDNTGVSKCYHEKKIAMDTVCELPHTGSLLLTPIVCDGHAIDVMVDKRLIDSHNVMKKTTIDFQKLKDDIGEGKMNEFQILSLVSTFLKETKQCSLSPYRELLIHTVKTKQYMLCRLTLANIMDRQTPCSYLFEALSVAIEEEENYCAMSIAWFITRLFFLANKVVLLDHILDIWPAFNCKHIQKSEKFVIVVELKCKMNNVHVPLKYFSVDIIYLANEDISKDNTNTVKLEESNVEVLFPDNKKIPGLSARDLFAKHSKLTLISKSSFQQRGIEKQCVNLFCKVKGFLPVGENRFPKIFCGMPTKVVQGSPEFMSKLRVGDMIGTDEFKRGTLGGFVKVRGDTAFLTCLHIFLNAEELAADKISLNDNKPLLVKCYPAIETLGASSSPSFICGKIRDIAFKTDNPESTSIDAALIKVKKKIEMCSTDYVSTGNQNTIKYEQIGLKSDFLNDSCVDYRQFCFSNPKLAIATVSVGAISRIRDTRNFKVDSEVSEIRKAFDVDIEPFDKSFNDVILENMKKMATSVVATIKKTFNSSLPLEQQIIKIVEGESDIKVSKETKQSIANIAFDVYCKSEANGGGDAPHDIDKLLQTSTIYHTSSILSGIISDVHMQKTFLKMSFDKESFKRISRRMYGQIHITNIRFQPGDSGMCIYISDPVQKVQGCIGMAIANHPQNGCIATPIMDILNYFNIRNESI